jgi:tetratricopeptide (TPR) repeat protein
MESMQTNPEKPAYFQLGNLKRMQGKLDEAAVCYRQALHLQPDDFRSLNNLGLVLKDLGNPEEAIVCFRQVLQLRPNDAAPYSNLGIVLRDQGRLDQAVECYRRALQQAPRDPAIHYNLGSVLHDQGKWLEAVVSYRCALDLEPNLAEIWNGLGNALQALGKLDEATASYRRALELKPRYADANNNLGNALKCTAYRHALRMKPDYAEAHNNLGVTLNEQGKSGDAIGCCRRAAELKPDYVEANYNLGNLLKDQGRMDDATAYFRRAADGCRRVSRTGHRPAGANNSLGNALSQLAYILGNRLPEEDLIAIRQLLSQEDVGGDSRIALHFSLAQVLDARGKYAEAAECLQHANALRFADLQQRNEDYQPAKHRDFVEAVIATCTGEFFARVNGFGVQTEVPVFIFGLPRSGTTLVEQILASHSQVFGAGELFYCEEMFQLLPKSMHRNDTPLECLRILDRETASQLAQQHLERLQSLDKRALRIVDKTPGTYHFLGLIAALFPKARLIHCRRDLRDVAVSCWMTDFARVAWACNANHIASHFEAHRHLMDHWRKVSPLPILDIVYEEMVADLKGVARRVVAWCGLDWESGCLKFHETRRPVRTASAVQVRRPLYATSVGRAKHYEQPLAALLTAIPAGS